MLSRTPTDQTMDFIFESMWFSLPASLPPSLTHRRHSRRLYIHSPNLGGQATAHRGQWRPKRGRGQHGRSQTGGHTVWQADRSGAWIGSYDSNDRFVAPTLMSVSECQSLFFAAQTMITQCVCFLSINYFQLSWAETKTLNRWWWRLPAITGRRMETTQ